MKAEWSRSNEEEDQNHQQPSIAVSRLVAGAQQNVEPRSHERPPPDQDTSQGALRAIGFRLAGSTTLRLPALNKLQGIRRNGPDKLKPPWWLSRDMEKPAAVSGAGFYDIGDDANVPLICPPASSGRSKRDSAQHPSKQIVGQRTAQLEAQPSARRLSDIFVAAVLTFLSGLFYAPRRHSRWG
jgi:hypothetical protein